MRAALCILQASPHYEQAYWALIFKDPMKEGSLCEGHEPARYTEALKMDNHRQGGQAPRPHVVEKFIKEDKVRRYKGRVYPIIRFDAVPTSV